MPAQPLLAGTHHSTAGLQRSSEDWEEMMPHRLLLELVQADKYPPITHTALPAQSPRWEQSPKPDHCINSHLTRELRAASNHRAE